MRAFLLLAAALPSVACRPSTMPFDQAMQIINRPVVGIHYFVCLRKDWQKRSEVPSHDGGFSPRQKAATNIFLSRITYCPDFFFTFLLLKMNCPAVSIVSIFVSPGIVLIPSDQMFRTFVSARIAIFSGITLGPNVR